jgi:hypothetical protein
MFVTSDARLARYNAVEGGHRDTLTVSEVVLDRVLTNLLWLKSPTLIKNLPLASIIAVHSRELFVDRGVWERFVETLRSLRERGRVSEEEVSVLLYDQRLDEMLRALTRDEVGRITPEFVARALEAAQGRRGALLEGRVAAERAAMERELAGARHGFDAEMARAEQEMVDKLLGALEEAKASLRKRAGNHAKRVHRGGLAVVAVTLCGLSIWSMPKVIESWNTIEPAAWLVGILWGPLIAYLGYRKDWFGVGEKLRARLFQIFYQRMLRGAEIERLEIRIRGLGDGNSRGVRE